MEDFKDKVVDIGANLTNRQFQRDLPQVLRRADDAGLDAILITGTSMRASRDALALVRRAQAKSKVKLFSTVGVHPHDAKDFDEDATLQEMRELITQNAGIAVAVGECGLDFNRDFSPRDKQERVFRAQVELACELQLPLFLHERDSHDVFVKVLTPFLEAKRLPPVVVHCFTGNEAELRRYLAMGFYIGLTGYVCMDSRGFKLRTMAAQIPLDKLLIETDAPFMYPYGNNTRARCEPKDLRAVVHTLASCYRESPSTIAAATTRNAHRFFALEKHEALRPANGFGTAGSHARPQRHEEKKTPAAPQATSKSPAKTEPSQVSAAGAVVIDGGSGEGGGQVIRISVALASVLKKKIRIHSIRSNRKVPGLRNQHVRTLQLAEKLTHGQVAGATLGSFEVIFDAEASRLEGGAVSADSETGGSVSLMIQGSLPAMLFSSAPSTLSLRGGTHVGFSPPVDFMQAPLTGLLARMGVEMDVQIKKRGFFPAGRGEITCTVTPLKQALRPIDISVADGVHVTKVYIRVTVNGESVSAELAQEFVAALKRDFHKHLPLSKETVIDEDVVVDVAAQAKPSFHRQGRQQRKSDAKSDRSNVSILTVIETSSGGVITVDRTEKDTPSYAAHKIVEKMAQHLNNEVCVDEHIADNLIIFMGLAEGTSRLRVPCKAHRSSQHLETALDLVAPMTGATYTVEENEKNALVTVHGSGYWPAK
ncbi:hypothetical protein Poli38472_005353 [Pythium oligandrum]|uniref:RNA 3'-terminal phosphate cyclase domain-containing protein n=1 Tax=Pythium oligandrum TaxID=41045 RepID=A0A8K1CHC2_PYTOL|nr:hypothetical protein Poli38472_005353 [Pythium oligandrum]|eukprot:TMW62735.1 hypothetical protein Poli38472_005353 [Pythium oligandrum]